MITDVLVGGVAGIVTIAILGLTSERWFVPLSGVAAVVGWRYRRRTDRPLAGVTAAVTVGVLLFAFAVGTLLFRVLS
jgi:dolichol kinase